MKASYTFGEFFLTMREKYKEVEPLFNELKNYISVSSEYDDLYFYADLINDDDQYIFDEDYYQLISNNRVRLYVEEKCSKFKKKFYDKRQHVMGLKSYYTSYIVTKNEDDTYSFNPIGSIDDFKPIITDQKKFSEIMNKIMEKDFMKLHEKIFEFNKERILLYRDYISMSTPLLGYFPEGSIDWNAKDDTIDYTAFLKTRVYNYYLEETFDLEIPSNVISSDWLEVLEENELKDGFIFNIEDILRSRKGKLKISEIEKKEDRGFVRLLKK